MQQIEEEVPTRNVVERDRIQRSIKKDGVCDERYI